MSYDGIVLAGGAGRRLGGAHKPDLTIAGRRLLDVALEALSAARTTVVVGPTVPTPRPVTWTVEDPPGGGPVAALAAGLSLVTSPTVVILASDLPFVSAEVVDSLRTDRGGQAAAIAVDDTGQDQPLIGCYDVVTLRAALPSPVDGAPMRALIRRLEEEGVVRRVVTPSASVLDCDTAEDIARAEALA